MVTNELLTLSIAAYAAIVSTFVLAWNVFKWVDTGPKVKLQASGGIWIVGDEHIDLSTYVGVTASTCTRWTRATVLCASWD